MYVYVYISMFINKLGVYICSEKSASKNLFNILYLTKSIHGTFLPTIFEHTYTYETDYEHIEFLQLFHDAIHAFV